MLMSACLAARDGNCIVVIEDNGPGIEAENIDRIFERFYTDRPDASQDFGQNSGLGLSISRQIAEAHGGTFNAENVIGSLMESASRGSLQARPALEKGSS